MRYFFNLADGTYQEDLIGTDLPSHQDARIEAVKFAAYILRDHPDMVWDGHDFRVEVTDDAKLLLFTLVMFAIDSPAMRPELTRPGTVDAERASPAP